MTLTQRFNPSRALLPLILAALAAVGMNAPVSAESFTFSGGPDGSTFQSFSEGIASRLSSSMEGVDLSSQSSAGSVENLRRVDARDADFGIVYAGDIYLGMQGKLDNDPRRYRNVRAVAYLYGAPAHLIVLEGSGITDVAQLAGKKVAVGEVGSGAAASARRFFEGVGLWDKIEPQYVGNNQGAAALGEGRLDALWVFAGFPNESVNQAANSNRIRLLQLNEAAEKGTLFHDHPYYATVIIPAGTYPGVDCDVVTIQDSALWVAGPHMDKDRVYQLMGSIYSPEGLAYLHQVHDAARTMTMASGLNGVVNKVHEGAARFWTENGLTLTQIQQ
ncbi:C4-dicarboxylate ABC transporter substrate-binding protein [Zobellella denitrificans]|uniref:TAXI family TRAP transporter solute-binding subunit n=1 Tax=Zobellella denitrificans TaxID=347534 RepID=UPI000B8C0BDE|nr:TAXI family TRAP transporter solute-binding subunit [Zobellella denitrificans]OXS16523.1 C4-dicarboxylate ABC transporter substrate-binding protein [Zobellella denitrificans]